MSERSVPKSVDGGVQAVVRRVQRHLEACYGSRLKAVILYGSYARRRARQDSDVDLLVVVDDTLDPWRVRRSLDSVLLDILLDTGYLVSVLVVPEHYYEGYRSPFLDRVRREGVRV